MSGEHRPRLWITPDRRRFFLVPQHLTLPTGELEVRSLQATSLLLDEGALLEHEVDLERASAHVDAGWEDALGRVRDTWRELIGAEKPDQPPDLGRWLGVTPGEVLTDPEKQRQGRRSLIERAAGLVGAGISETDVDRIDHRIEKITEAIVRDAARLRTGTEKLAERLEEQRPAIEATIEETGETLVGLGRDALARLRGLGQKPEPDEDP